MNSTPKESTNYSLEVMQTSNELVVFDKKRIIDALLIETSIDIDTATIVANEVELQIKTLKLDNLTSSLIRELVDIKLIERGFYEYRDKHARIGMSVYDIDNCITYKNNENSNITHSPEEINLHLAGNMVRQYALTKVFTKDIADAHNNGDIHVHDIDMVFRPYCSGHSIEYVKKYGLSLPNSLSSAAPAKNAIVLLSHMVKFAVAMQGCFAGAIGWSAVNTFFSPFLINKSYAEIKQLAQMMVYEFAQQAVSRGGQVVFTDLNISYEVPNYLEDVPAIGPGGTYTGKLYKDYIKEAQLFAKALMEVYYEGDCNGTPFMFPKILVNLTNSFFKTSGWEEFLEQVCEVASKMGSPYFVYNRGEYAKVSQCCRLSCVMDTQDYEDAKEPWKLRFSAIQNVTLNLPRIGYESVKDNKKLFMLISNRMDLIAKAHIQKRNYIKKLLDLGNSGPLALLCMNKDDQLYLRYDRMTYLIGLIGLNELVWSHTGEELHESPKALLFGLQVVNFMYTKAKELSNEYNVKFLLEESPFETGTLRLAKSDLKRFPDIANKYVQGDIKTDSVYYTNSIHYRYSSDINFIKRIIDQGKFSKLIEAGSITHVFLGEHLPPAKALMKVVINTYNNTSCEQLAFSPEFTLCNNCNKTSRGLLDKCPDCGSENIDGLTRITGYFSKTSSWNKGKLAELKDRRHESI
jgi:ribonucleoside-triphosphate reductase